MIEIDGSYGEGGGQILRTALSLSCLFRKPFRVFNVRKGRKRPGLMPQHLTAVRAAQLISRAEVKGDSAGSTELLFAPGEVKGGDFSLDIGTAGSTMLVLQTLIPALIFSKERTGLVMTGGTHVPFSPCFHYIEGIFIPFLKRLGIRVLLTIESFGFYPGGGGKIRAELFPAGVITPLKIAERGELISLTGCSGAGNLPLSIAERQRNSLLSKIHSELREIRCPEEIKSVGVPAAGQGTFLFLKAVSANSVAGFTSLGERGKRAELVGEEAAAEFLRYYSTGAVLDPHLPDQIALYLALGEGESEFTTSCVTNHLLTNLWVIGLFHEFEYSVEGEPGKPGRVRIAS
jgi:RNA 3'-terminal phosphate cyclase (ATP)